MSIATRIESISNHIEQAYDELQGLGADLSNVNKNIENISIVLDNIYDSMPQVNGEGTSLTLDNTRVGKIKSILKGNASQDETPTPNSPIPVNVVSGDNEIQVCGKNLFDKNNLQGHFFYNSNTYLPNATNNDWDCSNFIKVENNTQYTISLEKLSTTSANGQIIEWDKNKNGINNVWNIIENRTITTTGTTAYITIAYNNTVYTNAQVEKSNQATTYEAYQGNTYNIDLPVENEFALPGANTTNGITYSINDDNTINLNGTATANAAFILYKDLADSNITNGDTYTFFVNKNLPSGVEIRLEAFNDTSWLRHILNSALTSTTQKITNSANLTNATRIRYYIYVASGTSVNISNLGIQLEKGSKQNNFTPYGTTPIELCKIGNYQDYFGNSDGRNLFDGEVELGSINTAGDVTTNNALRSVNYIKVKPNTQYTISNNLNYTTRIYEYNNSKTYVTSSTQATSTYTFTTSTTTEYIRFRTIEGSVQNNLNIQVMLNKGPSALSWQPYGVGKWYLHKEISKVVLNGSESGWGASSSYSNPTIYSLYLVINDYKNNSSALSNLFSWVNSVSSSTTVEYIASGGNSIRLGIFRERLDTETLNGFKTWLENNNIILYYILNNPINIEITDIILINQLNAIKNAKSYNNQTNISQTNNNLPFIINATALMKNSN